MAYKPSTIASLEAMGIDLWVRRGVNPVAPVTPVPAAETPIDPVPQPSASAAAPETAAVQGLASDSAASADIAPGHAAAVDAGIATADLITLDSTVAGCTRCSLAAGRTNTVFGSGNPNADWMFVGEAPGREEERDGVSFTGSAGRLLDSILFALGFKREDVYTTGVLKCRATGPRDPAGQEVAQCTTYLQRQIELVKPRVIVVMGEFAARALLQSTDDINQLRDSSHVWRDSAIPLIVTHSPAYLLNNRHEKANVWEDLTRARQLARVSS